MEKVFGPEHSTLANFYADMGQIANTLSRHNEALQFYESFPDFPVAVPVTHIRAQFVDYFRELDETFVRMSQVLAEGAFVAD